MRNIIGRWRDILEGTGIGCLVGASWVGLGVPWGMAVTGLFLVVVANRPRGSRP